MPLIDPPLSKTPTQQLVRFIPDGGGPLDLRALFGNDRPVELEIGSGRGRFLMLAGYAHPEINYIGLEYARRYYNEAVERIGKRGLDNVRLVHAEALTFITMQLESASLAGLHIYFPDPWPKSRHHKRRLFRPDVISQLARIARRDACLRIATDHPGYARWIEQAFADHPDFARLEIAADDRFWDLPGSGPHSEQGVTNFEIKYRREGREIFWFAYRRR